MKQATWESFHEWLQECEEIPWEVAIEGRRVAQWGARYAYDLQTVVRTGLDGKTDAPPLPETLREFFPDVGDEFTQCIVNEYGAGDGIPWHSDDPAFGDRVLVYCFGDERPVLFRRSGDEQREVSLHVGHLDSYSFSGEARHMWKHSVPTGKGSRVSVTFRSMAEDS